ncbi:MAG: RNA polymerase sporulation sigma factor SigH [bacterium]|nr:RNA polymerase sporulation sigma factor SigH [bacterium]
MIGTFQSVRPVYQTMLDEEIALQAREGNQQAAEHLLHKYRNFIRGKAKSYFLMGADSDDIIQEGMIGLYKAIRDYKADRAVSFKAFAEICVTRQIITAIKAATRQKHSFLNSYVSLNKPINDECSDGAMMDSFLMGTEVDPQEVVIQQLVLHNLQDRIRTTLSGFEMGVLTLYLECKSYSQIAETLDKPVKSVDNALQRIKRKLGREILGNEDDMEEAV